MRKFATKTASRPNSVNLYFGVNLNGVLDVLLDLPDVLVGVLGVLVGVFFIGMVYMVF